MSRLLVALTEESSIISKHGGKPLKAFEQRDDMVSFTEITVAGCGGTHF